MSESLEEGRNGAGARNPTPRGVQRRGAAVGRGDAPPRPDREADSAPDGYRTATGNRNRVLR